MAERCIRCFRPLSTCLCSYTKEFDSQIKFVFLMHPKEAKKQRTGTGRLAKNYLIDSEILVGVDFTQKETFMAVVERMDYLLKVLEELVK